MNQLKVIREISKRYYIFRLDSYDGDNSSLTCEADGNDHMYAVLVVTDGSAEVIDMGYSSVEQLFAAWSDIEFANRAEWA